MLKNLAFSIIELMIVITIIGILSALAIPSYQNYIDRSRVAEAIAMVRQCKLDVDIGFNETGGIPTTACGLPKGGSQTVNGTSIEAYWFDYNVATASGTVWIGIRLPITIVNDATAARRSFHFGAKKAAGDSKLTWLCGAWEQTNWMLAANVQRLLPANCQGLNISTALAAL